MRASSAHACHRPHTAEDLAERLDRIAEEEKAAFAHAEPFPHVVIEDFLPAEVAEALWVDFQHTQRGWKHYHHYNERKLALTDLDQMPAHTRDVFRALLSQPAIDFVSKLSGIEGSTDASTRCTRLSPAGRPRRSVSCPSGAFFIGNEPPTWKLDPGAPIVLAGVIAKRPARRAALASRLRAARATFPASGFSIILGTKPI